MKPERFFLYRLLKADKLLFAVVCAYMLGVLYFALRQREEFPFFLYGMYSLKEEPKPTYTTYTMDLEGQEIKYAKLRNTQRELISSTLIHALPLMESGKLSKDDALKLKKWLMDYSGDMRLLGRNNMNVYRLTCQYDDTGKMHIIKKELVYTYAAD